MKYYYRALIGHMVISVCIFLFSVIGIIMVALITKLTFSVLEWLLNGSFDLSWSEILHSMKLGGVGGGILGIGIVLLRFFKVKGF
ncbi:hypothetical protein L1C56_16295 [Klebsiella pneumoniae]|uniref:hypothetical protein n=1 Tax=Klebsiella TaxID=570 RepID=UPI00068A51EB|nr:MULTISPECIES: hypothetical protein [Klebsiella]HBZ7223002.1 hypothetical protein [Klebsiella variicola subsp. variicola]HCI6432810.1 hypothetical protein [Klebsiella quasipneumoniae subsp. similipneumoniae]EKV3466038.1 hypothetical protein [Klebsiella pneumoniae]EKX4112101.1 hypothetical protein [Klebsiella pneumoniae]MBG2062863.1 hypothetical protein [Klebsiella pneumoniae]